MHDKKVIQVRISEELKKTQMLIEKYKELTKPIAPENAIGRISRMDAIKLNSITLEKEFLKKPFKGFKELDQAIEWIEGLLKN